MSEWIKCEDRMPPEHESFLARFKNTDKWTSAMWEMESDDVLIVAEYNDGTRKVDTSKLMDGVWQKVKRGLIPCKVTHWMPFPELPEKEGEQDDQNR